MATYRLMSFAAVQILAFMRTLDEEAASREE